MWRPRRQFAIGDIHGHYDELMALYKQFFDFAFDPKLDQVIALGDLIDVGPKSREVVQQFMDWQEEFDTPTEKHFIALYGNHEDLLLDAINPLHPVYGDPELWLEQGGNETLKSYTPKLAKLSKKAFQKARKNAKEFLDPEHIRWLSALPYYIIDEDYVFVHGGLPDQPLQQIVQRSQLNDPKLNYDLVWLSDEFIYSTFQWGKRIIFGHTPSTNGEPIVTPTKIGLNTMPRNEGKLTAIEIPSLRFIFQQKLS